MIKEIKKTQRTSKNYRENPTYLKKGLTVEGKKIKEAQSKSTNFNK